MLKKSVALLTLALFVGAFGAAFAGDDHAHGKGEAHDDKATQAEHANMEGTLVCMGCSLKKGGGARAQCSEYGHTHALKTADGDYVSFLPNQYAADLMAGEKFHNKAAKVHGVYFANANQLDVETYEIDGQKYGWCDHCSAMDGCAFSMKK
jgi:hypothetical protein